MAKKSVDEIQNFQDARWVSPPEALWRIYEFHPSEMQPSVINLELHLPDRQTGIAYVYGFSKFITNLICTHISAAYPVGILLTVTANPREGERYYLRLLLNHVRGPLSFKDLLTVNERQCETFKEAAKERGLLESDNSISECLREAVLFKMPSALKNLFATILVHCNPTDIRKLWETYYEDMSEDFRKIHDNSPVAQLQCTLKSINYFLEGMAKKIDKYDISKLDHERDNGNISECRKIIEERSIKVSPEDSDAQSNLNPEQEQAFKTILQRVDSGRAGLFFVDGPGETGKTFLYRALLANLISRSMIAFSTATSGVAAVILPGDRTTHSRFDIPLQTTDTTITNMSKQSGGAKLIRKSKLIIWDEAPMANRQTIEIVDRSFRDIMDINEPFDGKVMVFGGDFRQVLPVVPKSTRAETINASLVTSYLGNKMEKIQLTRNMRARADPTFNDFLQRIGNGDEPTIRDDMVLLPEKLIIKHDGDSTGEDNLIREIFPSLDEKSSCAKYMTERAILASRNEYVDQLNCNDPTDHFEL
ncbi:uncharacterized protein [Nicotiana tomentosiformis]|uniref:uncharacterized protein n=1 Tax=Nicotiana tomentosiformis TaxID=4098 RepID=UPI00388C4A7D